MSHPSAATREATRTGAPVSPELRLELRRIANLFLVSAVTLALSLLRVFAEALHVSFIPREILVVWGGALLVGWATTYVYAIFVTFKARRLGWLVWCLLPFTCVPAAVAYAWARRMELEREVLGDGVRARQRRGGKQ
jgi:hypothetical protein